MLWINGRRYVFKGVYGTWNEAVTKGKTIKRTTHKRWFIKKTTIGYQLYTQQ